jgi:hypothetical protein
MIELSEVGWHVEPDETTDDRIGGSSADAEPRVGAAPSSIDSGKSRRWHPHDGSIG